MVILTLTARPTWAILYFTFANRERERVGSGQYRIFDTLMGTLYLYLILNSQNANLDARGTCWREHQAGCPLINLIVQMSIGGQKSHVHRNVLDIITTDIPDLII